MLAASGRDPNNNRRREAPGPCGSPARANSSRPLVRRCPPQTTNRQDVAPIRNSARILEQQAAAINKKNGTARYSASVNWGCARSYFQQSECAGIYIKIYAHKRQFCRIIYMLMTAQRCRKGCLAPVGSASGDFQRGWGYARRMRHSACGSLWAATAPSLRASRGRDGKWWS